MRVELTPDAWKRIGTAPLYLKVSTTPSSIRYVVSEIAPVSLDVQGEVLSAGRMVTGEGDVYAKAVDVPSSVVCSDMDHPPTASEIAKLAALPIPAYPVADLPLANLYPNCVIRITDNPQGQAESNGVDWISTVDGSNLGPGHG